MRFEFREPDLVTDPRGVRSLLEQGEKYTGLIKTVYKGGVYALCYYEEGIPHKELGPAYWRSYDGLETYYHNDLCNGVYYMPIGYQDYWKAMYEKYRGTDKETICMVNMLAAQ